MSFEKGQFYLERIVCQPSFFRGLCLLVFGKLPRNNKKQSKNENSLSFSMDHPSQNSCRRWDFTSTARSAKGMHASKSGMPGCGMSMVLSKWIITPIQARCFRSVNRWNKPTYQLVTNFHGQPSRTFLWRYHLRFSHPYSLLSFRGTGVAQNAINLAWWVVW